MNNSVTTNNGDDRSNQNQDHPQTLQADLTARGSMMIPEKEQITTRAEQNHADSRSNQPFLNMFSVLASIFVGISLVVVGLLQFGFYSRQAKIMGNQTRIVANQLKLSQNTERAVLLVDGIDLSQQRAESDQTPQGLGFVIFIRNSGYSTAPIDEIKVISMFHLQKGALPNVPNYFARSINTVITPIIQNDTAYAYIQMRDITASPGSEP